MRTRSVCQAVRSFLRPCVLRRQLFIGLLAAAAGVVEIVSHAAYDPVVVSGFTGSGLCDANGTYTYQQTLNGRCAYRKDEHVVIWRGSYWEIFWDGPTADTPLATTAQSCGLLPPPTGWTTLGECGGTVTLSGGVCESEPPTVTSIIRQNPLNEHTNSDEVIFRVTFSEQVRNVSTDGSDFTLSGTANGTIGSVSANTPDTVFDVRITGVVGDGELELDIARGNDIQDHSGTALGDSPAIGREETYTIDHTAPIDPALSSHSHAVGAWSNDATVDIEITGASDPGGSGVDGFAYGWDRNATWTVTQVKNAEESWSGSTFTATSDGDWYFHIATVDNAGNWTSTRHLGPFRIDTSPPSIPTGLSPADDTYTSDASPTLCWDAAGDAGGSGLRAVNTYRVIVIGEPSRDYYTANTTYTPTLADGVFTWKVYSRDNAGNCSDWSSGHTLTIDREPPGVTSFTRQTPATRFTNADQLVFRATFDEAGRDVGVADFTVYGATTARVTGVSMINDWTYDVTVSEGDLAGVNGEVGLDLAGAQNIVDLAGNPLLVGEPPTDETYRMDNTVPIDPTPTSSSHRVGDVSNDEMVDIEITGASDPDGSGVDGFAYGWDRNATWTVTQVKNVEESWSGGTFTATSDGDWYFHIATVDNAGNWTSTQHLGPFPIDTAPPVVLGVEVDTDPMYEGALTQQVVVTFNEAMDTETTPALTFSRGTFTSHSDGGWSAGSTVWTETFTLRDSNEEIPGVTVTVTGAKDVAGNDQEACVKQAAFAIDTLAPAITSITSTTPDGCYPVGATLSLTVTFSENVTLEASGNFSLILSSTGDVVMTPPSDAAIATGTYAVSHGHNSCDLNVSRWDFSHGWMRDSAGNVLDVDRSWANVNTNNLGHTKDIIVDTTAPVAIDDPDGDEDRSGCNDSEVVDVRLDPYGIYRLVIREDTPVYIDVKANDSDLPCTVPLRIYDIPQGPRHGTATIGPSGGNIRYAPKDNTVGPDQFTYRICDACGNVSQEAVVYVEVVRQLEMEDQYLTVCAGEAVEFDVSMRDVWVGEEEFEFAIVAGPLHGVVIGDPAEVTESAPGLTTWEIEQTTTPLRYAPAGGFVGRDTIGVRVADAFGGETIAWIDLVVGACGPEGEGGGGLDARVKPGERLSVVVPRTFETVLETKWGTVTLTSLETGTAYSDALSAVRDARTGRFVLFADSMGMPRGEYELVIPLGNRETVTLGIEIGEAE